MPGSIAPRPGTSSWCRGSRFWPESSSARGSTSTRYRPSRRRKTSAALLTVSGHGLGRAEGAGGLDRRAEVEALVLGLLDQHHGLERVDVVDALLVALGRDLGLVRPVVELHLRDAGDLTDLPQVELDLVEVLGEVDRLEEICCLVVGHAALLGRGFHFESYSDLLPVMEEVRAEPTRSYQILQWGQAPARRAARQARRSAPRA